ncbi:IclR family transcriptional regulator [Phenylobacterium sp.]|uniref:IclR family transcriptional regulator n=1 Tax=Phenylobacterium sp. TaxID=1871053 RepID=UPI0025CE4211|nr:IclR family transcriptional regulator C-terminal domain-containing protein [Phenylobacterium sp.]MBX3482024.1 helix-turn-helix domain-containing protein [Phenylobacterium sp.]MCW5758250.1 helix-turn-helix domain-containing protein [Phenylobacterium sp.]
MSDDKNIVKSVAKAFAVLQAFGPDATEMVLADVARAAGLDNAGAFRLLNTLVMLGYVERVPDTRRFRLTFKCLELGFNAIARSDIRSLARPLLRAIVGERIEAASIGVLDGHEVVYIERIQAGLERLAVDIRVGNRVPAYSSAIGRAILSRMPLNAQRAILEAAPPRRLTDRTIIDVDTILAQIAETGRLGYAFSDQETVTGLRVIAAPITDVDGVPVAAVSAAAPAFGRTEQEFLADTRDLTVDAAARLSEAVRAAGGMAAHRHSP